MRIKAISCGVLMLFGALALAAQSPDLQQKAAAAKEAAARNQQALRSYSWITKTELSLKGEVKNTKIESCQYGPDGKVHKTELSEPPPPPEEKPGRKGRRKEKIIAKKTGEMKAELEAGGSARPELRPARTGEDSSGDGRRQGHDGPRSGYRRAENRGLRKSRRLPDAHHGLGVGVDTSDRGRHILDKPDDKVTLAVNFQSLPDGNNYVGETGWRFRGTTSKSGIENSNYQKVSP